MPGPRKQSFAKPKNAKGTFRRILTYFKPYRAQLDAKTAAILETITGLTDKEIDAIYSGMNTSITKKVEAFTPNDVDKKLIDTAKNEYTVGTYLDITMMLNIKDADSKAIIEKNITKLSKPVDILYKLSDDLLNKDNTKVRSYVIIRVHDGVADIITPQFNEAIERSSSRWHIDFCYGSFFNICSSI